MMTPRLIARAALAAIRRTSAWSVAPISVANRCIHYDGLTSVHRVSSGTHQVRLNLQTRPASNGATEFDFDREADETLGGQEIFSCPRLSKSHLCVESLCEKFEELVESRGFLAEADVTLASGVLTVVLPEVGTYVINKQGPNQQIWLSSPNSGPARFDWTAERYEKVVSFPCRLASFARASRLWIYNRTGQSLHDLLDAEIGRGVLKETGDVGFKKCHMGGEDADP